METAFLIIFVIMATIGLVGIIVPGLPDTILIFAGALIYAGLTRFQDVSLITILILASLTATTIILDWVGTIYGAKKFGATKYGIIGAVCGAIIGFIFLSFLGLAIGALSGTIIAEIYIAKKEYKDALRAGTGTLIGVIAGSVIKMIIAIAMIIIFILDLIY